MSVRSEVAWPVARWRNSCVAQPHRSDFTGEQNLHRHLWFAAARRPPPLCMTQRCQGDPPCSISRRRSRRRGQLHENESQGRPFPKKPLSRPSSVPSATDPAEPGHHTPPVNTKTPPERAAGPPSGRRRAPRGCTVRCAQQQGERPRLGDCPARTGLIRPELRKLECRN